MPFFGFIRYPAHRDQSGSEEVRPLLPANDPGGSYDSAPRHLEGPPSLDP